MAIQLYPLLQCLVNDLENERSAISPERRGLLYPLIDYISTPSLSALNFICTHNSRRSQLGQVWATVGAAHYGRSHLKAYSGGTEATALHPNTIAALERAGFNVTRITPGDNPVCQVFFSDDAPPVVCYSKLMDHPDNPSADFAAVMTCSEADAGCPFVPGATMRVPLTYEDPKVADGTPQQSQVYDARLRQIGRELLWAVGQPD